MPTKEHESPKREDRPDPVARHTFVVAKVAEITPHVVAAERRDE